MYSELDYLYQDIKPVCQNCQDHDCEGYVWLLRGEVDSLLGINIPIIEINDSAFFIHSFEEEDGTIKVEKPRPPCHLRRSKSCSIYNNRPLVCRMYPVGLVTDKEDVVIALHKDCEYSRRFKTQDKKQFFDHFVKILRQTPKSLLNEILDNYRQVDVLSAFPEGTNTFEVIVSSRVILNERR
jgi:Fe-S-cluster containining protein